MDKERHFYIDLIRAVSMFGVMIVHILAFNRTTPFKIFTWNYLQTVVVSFIFCSVYVMSERYLDKFNSVTDIIRWYKKRIVRLVIPLYWYLLAHYSLWFLFPHYFQGIGLGTSPSFIVRSFLLTGGASINWLPILFIELTILFPFLSWVSRSRLATALYSGAAVVLTYIFYSKLIPLPNFRFTMWAGWSLVFLLFITLYNIEKNESKLSQTFYRYIQIGVMGLLLYGLLAFPFFTAGKDVVFFNHKYPPDFIYLTYTTGMMFFIVLLCRLPVSYPTAVRRFVEYTSKKTYTLFFVHLIFYDIVLTARSRIPILKPAIPELVVVFIASFATLFMLDKLHSFFAILKSNRVERR